MGLKEGQWGWGVRGKKFQLHHKTFLAIVLCAWKPHAREASHAHGGKKPKNSTPKGAGGYPKFFFTPNLIFFVTLNSVQNFKTVAHTLLGEKFVWVVGGGWVVVVV